MQDYLVCLKLDNGLHMFQEMLPRFVHLFYLMGDSLYLKANIQNLVILHHHKRHIPALHRTFINNVNLFNAECGEISFSVLSRCTLGDTMKAASTT